MQNKLFVKVKKIFRQQNTFFEIITLPDNPRYAQWTIPYLLYQTRRNSPLVYKGLVRREQTSKELVQIWRPVLLCKTLIQEGYKNSNHTP